MDNLNRYLKDVWSLTQAQYATKKAKHINVSLGNVSGDMDSVVCSVVLGYYLTFHMGFYEDEESKEELDAETISEERLKKFYVPILNMAKTDLEARSDIIHHFENLDIKHAEIPAYDEIDLKHYAELGALGVNLVDHNLPDCTQEFLTEFVERIYDHHHEKEQHYPGMIYKDIRFCGSAATLVAKAILDDDKHKHNLLDHKVAWFASAPILIDTVNFSEHHRGKKWDQVDEDIYVLLKEFAGETIPHDYFRTLYLKKTDIQTNIDLGLNLLLRKDYKNFKIPNTGLLGISTVFLDLRIMEKEFGGPEMMKAMKNIMEEKGLDINGKPR
jgi:inorganic pyrophosphatase/exopolyphosphatase